MQVKVQNKDGTIGLVETPECYKKPLQWDHDACSRCRFDMKCYDLWDKYLKQNKEGLWGN